MLWSTLCKCMQLAGLRLKETANFTISSSTYRGWNSNLKKSRALLSKTSNIMLLHCCLKRCCALCWSLMTWKSEKLLSRKFFQPDVSNQPRRGWRRSQPITLKLPTGHNWLAFLKVASVSLILQKLLWPGAARCIALLNDTSLIYQSYLHTPRVLKRLLNWHLKLVIMCMTMNQGTDT